MRRTDLRQGLRTMKFEKLLERWHRRELSQGEAAEALGMSERSFRRWHTRWLEEGEAGLHDRRIGQPSPRRLAAGTKSELCRLFREVYPDHTVKHFHEQLVKRHDYRLGYTVTKLTLHAAGLVRPARRRGAHRKKRPRRPLPGMLLFQDGSRFAWLPGSDRQLDLIVTMEDATSDLYSALLVEEEGTASSFLGLAETIAAHGLFCALYSDRGSHYFSTPEAGGKVDKTKPTQVGRALAQLGIDHIASYSPEARGRMERVFRTLQDRLPKELRLAGIGGDVEATNRFIREVYLPEHNARFAVAAEQPGSAFVPVYEAQWRDILCSQEERVVANDNTVRYHGRILQIPESPLRRHFVRATVRVHEYPDGALAIFHGPRCLARYRADGSPLEQPASRDASRSPRPACGYVDGATPPTYPQAHHQQKRSIDVLRKPANLTR